MHVSLMPVRSGSLATEDLVPLGRQPRKFLDDERGQRNEGDGRRVPVDGTQNLWCMGNGNPPTPKDGQQIDRKAGLLTTRRVSNQ